MKKQYIIPTVEIHQLASQLVLNSVSETIRSNNGIGYGGVDEAGTKDPSAKQRDMYEPSEEMADDQQVWEKGLW
ncbi:MAG: hypothetical protein IJT97_07645 [Bacteroidaceae bacterium]|nr:hypothetical protein [Bacteroidaceae bacterium]